MNRVPLLRGLAVCGKRKQLCFARVLGLAFVALALPLALPQTPTVIPNHGTYHLGVVSASASAPKVVAVTPADNAVDVAPMPLYNRLVTTAKRKSYPAP